MLRITTLVENSTGEHHALIGEHGISFYIEKDGHRILFDTGQSNAFLLNAFQMNIKLTDLDFIVLSHGHYDHSGGFRHIGKICNSFNLRLGKGFFDEKYAFRKGAWDYLGNNFDEEYLKERNINYSFVSLPVEEILTGVYILQDFPNLHKDENTNPRFFIRKEGKFKPDRFEDEVLMAVDTQYGLVVLLGCSHPGMRNMLDSVRRNLKRPVIAVLGGTHLVESKGRSLERSLEYLEDPEIEIAGVSHCTGEEAMQRLEESNRRYVHNVTGTSFFFDQV